MSPIEVVAVVATLLSVWLSVRRNILTWPTGIVGVSAYFVVFLRARLYADMALQVLFFVQCCYGWWAWHRGEQRAELPIRRLSTRGRIGVLATVALAAWTAGTLLSRHTNASAPYWDAAASVLSIVANQLLARRVLENWVLWIAADTLYVGIFAWKELYLSAGLYALFLGMVIAGLRRWTCEYRAGAGRGTTVAEAVA
ncbi:MAG: nicotinamide riboside transporter PnuC [Gemmatimonadaceae bacterium]